MKIRGNLPKSAGFQVIQSTVRDTTAETRNSIHYIKVTYSTPAEALKDKTGKPIREMVVPLQQITQSIKGPSRRTPLLFG